MVFDGANNPVIAEVGPKFRRGKSLGSELVQSRIIFPRFLHKDGNAFENVGVFLDGAEWSLFVEHT
jgi:hypothetical protein